MRTLIKDGTVITFKIRHLVLNRLNALGFNTGLCRVIHTTWQVAVRVDWLNKR